MIISGISAGLTLSPIFPIIQLPISKLSGPLAMDALVNAKANINGSTIATETQSALSLDSGSLFVLLTTLLVFFGPLFMLFPPFPPSKSDALTETHNKLGPEPSEAPTLTDRIKALLVFAFNAPSVTSDSSNRSGSSSGSVTSLAVYPIASCRGVPLARAKVTPLGLEFDRLFTFAQLKSPFPLASIPENSDDNEVAAKGHRWESITRQQFPELANLEVELWQPDLAKIKGFRDPIAGSSRETFLILRFPWRSEGLIAGLWDVFAAKCSQGRRAQPAIEIMLPVELPNEAERSAKGYEFEELQLRGFSKGSSSSSGGGQKGGEEVVTALNMGADLPRELRWFLGVSNKLALFRLDRGQGSKVVEVDQDSVSRMIKEATGNLLWIAV